jgi:cysteinyl-tRNA synthetase
MSMATLLEPFGGGLECDDPTRNTFDIHGGGIDLVFPHHENEVAQSCCAFGSSRMANVWVHNGFLQVESEKMSKSLGNFVTIRELLETAAFGGRRWSGEVLRLAMLRTHYRQPIDWTVKALEEAEATLNRWYGAVGDVEAGNEILAPVFDALSDDLNTPAALYELHRLAHPATIDPTKLGVGHRDSSHSRHLLKSSANLLGLLQTTRTQHVANALKEAAIDTNEIEKLVAVRSAARANKNWAESDRLRDQLAALGVAIKDNKDGATTWELKR